MGMGCFLLISGKVGDIFGPKPTYILGMLFHAAFNLGIGFTKTVPAFTILRGLSGVALAFTLPTGIAMLAHVYPAGSHKRHLAFSAFAICATLGWSFACFHAAIFATYTNWRWIFFSIAIIALAIAISAYFMLPEECNVHKGSYTDLDYLGITVGMSSLLLITAAIDQGATVGWHKPYVYIIFIIGILLVIPFIFIEMKVSHPAMPLSTWKNPIVAAMMICLTMAFIGFGIFLLFITLLLEHRGFNLIHIAIQWIPSGCAAAAAFFLIPYLLKAGLYVTHILCPASILCFCVSHVLIATAPLDQTYWAQVFFAIIIMVPGSLWLPAATQMLVSASVISHDHGIAGSLVLAGTALPVAWGISCASMVQEHITKHGGSAIKGINGAAWLGFALGVTAFILSLIMNKRIYEANARIMAGHGDQTGETSLPTLSKSSDSVKN